MSNQLHYLFLKNKWRKNPYVNNLRTRKLKKIGVRKYKFQFCNLQSCNFVIFKSMFSFVWVSSIFIILGAHAQFWSRLRCTMLCWLTSVSLVHCNFLRGTDTSIYPSKLQISIKTVKLAQAMPPTHQLYLICFSSCISHSDAEDTL